MRELMAKLGEAPAGQADPEIAATCARMAREGYTADEVKALLDQIVHAGLASDFFVKTLDMVWRDAETAEDAV